MGIDLSMRTWEVMIWWVRSFFFFFEELEVGSVSWTNCPMDNQYINICHVGIKKNICHVIHIMKLQLNNTHPPIQHTPLRVIWPHFLNHVISKLFLCFSLPINILSLPHYLICRYINYVYHACIFLLFLFFH